LYDQTKIYNLIPRESARQLPEEAFTFSADDRETIESDLFRRDIGRHAVRYLLGETSSRQPEAMLASVVRLQLHKPREYRSTISFLLTLQRPQQPHSCFSGEDPTFQTQCTFPLGCGVCLVDVTRPP